MYICIFVFVQLSTIIDLLEGSMYGMDLLKLHSVTTKLLSRMDNMEKVSTDQSVRLNDYGKHIMFL